MNFAFLLFYLFRHKSHERTKKYAHRDERPMKMKYNKLLRIIACSMLRIKGGKRMVTYLLEQEKILLSALKDDENLVETYEYAKVQIVWLSHERLVHLLVTLFISFLLILSALGFLLLQNPLFGVMAILLMILVLFYLFHYYRLENGVQRLYKLANQIHGRINS